jgi:hypothetical protein
MNFTCKVTIAPLRAEPSHKSEMVSQILFGESVLQINQQQDWLKVICINDDYEGWVELKSLQLQEDFDTTNFKKHIVITESQVIEKKTLNILRLVPGSEIYLNTNNETKFGNKYFDFAGKSVAKRNVEFINADEIINHAFHYLNTPYLWGGRTIFGIDCSGFTQSVFKLNNFELPRDAYQQADLGELVNFGNQTNADIAFFKNENNKITHVGFCINNDEIIHCSGFVRIDKLTADGIISKDENLQTHTLAYIKRIGKRN